MTGAVTAYVREQPVYDVHEHHMPQVLGDPDVGLLKLFRQSYLHWTQADPFLVPFLSAAADEAETRREAAGAGTWSDVATYVENSGSNAFVRTLVAALVELYELDEGRITPGNWEALDAEIRRRHADSGWPAEVLARARVERIITDPYLSPLLDARAELGELYRSVARINALAFGWHPSQRDADGNSAHELASELGIDLDGFEDYERFLEHVVDTMGTRHQLALKNALAYDRHLDFDEPQEPLARRAWGQADPSAEERKAFGDLVVDRLCTLAADRDVPVQIHLGSALIRGSHPLNIAGLVERHPGTRFLLMHFAYPWSRDLFGLAFAYRNIWLDMTWAFMLSPSHFKLALHEGIEVLSDESRLMLGGDCWHVEETYGALALARRLIGEVLEEKVRDGYLDAEGARRLARKMLHENARALLEPSPRVGG